jgi:hypothetical protein
MIKLLICFAIIGMVTAQTCSTGAPLGQTVYFYSDATTLAQGPAKATPGPSSLVFPIHSAWRLNQVNEKWISDAPDTRILPAADTIRYFTKVINLPATPTKAQLGVSADNSFWTYINGQAIPTCFDATERNFNRVVPCDITQYLSKGDNVIEWKVRNWPQPGGSYLTNPTGLMYNLAVTL